MTNSVSTKIAKTSENAQNLRNVVELLKGTSIVNITTRTLTKLTGGKKNEQQGRVEKVTVTPAIIYNDSNKNVYENKVNRELVKEGKEANFVVSDPKWGYETVAAGIKVYTTKAGVTDHYLQYIQVGKPRSFYLLDGEPINRNDIIGLPVVEQYASSQGGLENQVQIRMVKLQNIQRLAVKGMKLVGSFYYE